MPLRSLLAVSVLATAISFGQDAAEAKPKPESELVGAKEKGGELDITAETAEMDFNNRVATLVGSVKVSDERMVLVADKMVVHLAEGNKLKMIEAIGNVVISEVGTQRKAKAGMAVFEVATDKVVLTDNPTLEDADWGVRSAEKMVYDRKNGKFLLSGKNLNINALLEGGKSGTRSLFPPAGGGNAEEKKDEPK
jgi:lipopolysaccharide transport protein LptA